ENQLKEKEKIRALVRALSGVARETQKYASTEEGQRKAIPPCDFRQLRRTLQHIRVFQKDIVYLREIFKLDYSPVLIPKEHRDAYMQQVDQWFDKYFGVGVYAQKIWDENGDPLIDPGPPQIDTKRKKVIFGNETLGKVELDLGTLRASSDDFLDTSGNRVMLWMMAKDIKLGLHNGLLGEKGAGKSTLTDFMFKNVLRRHIERMQLTNRSKGTEFTGKAGLKDAVTHFVDTPLAKSMRGGTDLLIDEATDGAGALSALNNPLEFGFI